MRLTTPRLYSLLLLALPVTSAEGQFIQRTTCYIAAAPIRIDGRLDGRLDEVAWSFAVPLGPFRETASAEPSRFRTTARMLWDETYFYIAAELEEPHVWGTLKDRDQIVFHDNDFEVFIDPDGDTREYYEIEINALNTVFDLFLERTYIDGGPAHHEWNLEGLKTAVHVDGTLNDPSDVDRGWSVEFALPWRSLAEYAHKLTPPLDGDIWRVNFSRVQWRHRILNGSYEKTPDTPEDNWVWSPQGEINLHIPGRWGYVEFASALNRSSLRSSRDN